MLHCCVTWSAPARFHTGKTTPFYCLLYVLTALQLLLKIKMVTTDWKSNVSKKEATISKVKKGDFHLPSSCGGRAGHSHVTSVKDPRVYGRKISTFKFLCSSFCILDLHQCKGVACFTSAIMYLSLVSIVWLMWGEASSVLDVPSSEGLWEITGLFLKYWTTKTTWKEGRKEGETLL